MQGGKQCFLGYLRLALTGRGPPLCPVPPLSFSPPPLANPPITETAGNPGGAVYTVSLSQNAPEGHELELAIPERPYIHIEYTNGYLICE